MIATDDDLRRLQDFEQAVRDLDAAELVTQRCRFAYEQALGQLRAAAREVKS